jgi:hypothetical protein
MSTARRLVLLVPFFVAGFVAGFLNVQPLLLLSSLAEQLVRHSPAHLEQPQTRPLNVRLAVPHQQVCTCFTPAVAAHQHCCGKHTKLSIVKH